MPPRWYGCARARLPRLAWLRQHDHYAQQRLGCQQLRDWHVRAARLRTAVRCSPAANEITAIDRINGTLTAGTTWNVAIPGLSDGHYLYRAGDEQNGGTSVVPTGFDGWIVVARARYAVQPKPQPGPGALGRPEPGRYRHSHVGSAHPRHCVPGHPGRQGSGPALSTRRTWPSSSPSWTRRKSDGQLKGSTAGSASRRSRFAGSRGPVDIRGTRTPRRAASRLPARRRGGSTRLARCPRFSDFPTTTSSSGWPDDAYEVRVGTYGNMYTERPLGSIVLTNFGTAV